MRNAYRGKNRDSAIGAQVSRLDTRGAPRLPEPRRLVPRTRQAEKWLATRPAGGVSRSTIPEDPIHRGDVLFGHTAFSEGATRRARSVTPSGGPELSGPSSVRDVDVTNPDFTRRTRGGASRPGTDAASVRSPSRRRGSRAGRPPTPGQQRTPRRSRRCVERGRRSWIEVDLWGACGKRRQF